MARTATTGELKHKIEASNIILECFGNASTVINRNSSRVGRKISFNCDKKISGARIETYLLEKSRVTHQSKGERNFHIFYQLLAHKNIKIYNDFIDTTNLYKPKEISGCDHSIVNLLEKINCKCETGSPIIVDEDESKAEPITNDKSFLEAEYAKVLHAFEEIGFTSMEYIENVLLGIVYLGSISFDTANKDLQVVKNDEFVKATTLLNVDGKTLEDVLVRRSMVVGNERIEVSNSLEDAITIRNSIARDVYTNLFDYIVNVINEKLSSKEVFPGRTIAILDIFGFEIFEKNSLDQLCINWTNEKIQNEFLKRIFTEKQKDYEREGLCWDSVAFEDNSDCIDEIERPCGLLDLIDEESNNSWGTPENLAQKIKQYLKKHVSVKYKNSITIKHYAGNVNYDLTEFLDKNRERSTLELRHLGLPNKSKRTSAIRAFAVSLKQLFESINKSQIKYIRCIKPNNKMRPLDFDERLVHNQLVATGITETIKISRQLFPQEMLKETFYKKFTFVEISKFGCIEGTSKVFMSSKVRQGLEAARMLIKGREGKLIKELFENCHKLVKSG